MFWIPHQCWWMGSSFRLGTQGCEEHHGLGRWHLLQMGLADMIPLVPCLGCWAVLTAPQCYVYTSTVIEGTRSYICSQVWHGCSPARGEPHLDLALSSPRAPLLQCRTFPKLLHSSVVWLHWEMGPNKENPFILITFPHQPWVLSGAGRMKKG